MRGQLEEGDPGRQVGGRVLSIQPQLTASGQTVGQKRLKSGLRIRIHFIRIRIQHVRLNRYRTDPDPDLIWIRIRIQSGGSKALITKNWKKLELKKNLFFLDQKLRFTYP